MSPVEEWAISEVRARLVAARQANDTVSVEELRESIGIGHSDLAATLDHLREQGEAVEEAPGDWTAGSEDRQLASDPAAATMDRFDGKQEGEGALPDVPEVVISTVRVPPPRGAGEVVLTMAVASALDAETIGKLVEAGIAEAKADDRAFVLRVVT